MNIRYRNLVLIAIFASMTAVGAFIKIPTAFMPITLQALFSVLAGLLLGAKFGSASQAIYMIMGLVGIPIFAKGGGLWYLSEPSFGFIIGFVACAAITGAIVKINNSKAMVFFGSFCGLLALYIIGGSYIYVILTLINLKSGISLWYIIANFVFPYIVKDFILFMLASLIYIRVKPLLNINS